VPLSLDDAVAAFLLLFPPALGDLCRRFDVSSSLQQNSSLVAALIPWRLSPKYQAYEWRKRFSTHHLADETIFKPTLDAGRWSRSLRVKSHYHHALRILQFPKWLHDYMSQPNRAYCVWWESGDGTKKDQGLETTLLFSIMEQCRAKNVGHKADVRAVFVHVGALRSLHKLPALVERRSKRPEVNFYTYGTHESVPSERWGIHEIFPIGRLSFFRRPFIRSSLTPFRWYSHVYSNCFGRRSHRRFSSDYTARQAPTVGLLHTSVRPWNGRETDF